MSTQIEQRIIQMKFDNAQFESAMKQSKYSLEEMDKLLNKLESNNAFEQIDKSAKKVDLTNISKGVETISSRFTSLGIIGTQVLQNLTTLAMSTGSRIASALTIDPITTGFTEYETKMNAVQTILTNTASKGTTLSQVTAALDELNTYADQTIYNFAEMARNVGFFTSAGVSLEDSTAAIKGLSNLAAGSGTGPQQAANAMYQMSQALSAGAFTLMDYNSLVNAGMGGELFKQAAIDAGIAAGAIKEGQVTLESFRGSLEDRWLTSDILKDIFVSFSNDDALLSAAQDVKTLTQLLGTLAEAIQSGWAKSFEYIFGDFEQAKTLFTGVSNIIGNIINESSDARNEVLSTWESLGGREDLIQGIKNIFDYFLAITKPIKEAFETIFPPKTADDLKNISSNFLEFTNQLKIDEPTMERTSIIFTNIFGTMKNILSIIGNVASAFGLVSKEVINTNSPVWDLIEGLTYLIYNFTLLVSEMKIFDSVGTLMSDVIFIISSNISTLVGYVDALYNGFDSISNVFKTIFDNIIIALTPLYNMIKNIMAELSITDVLSTGGIIGIFMLLKKLLPNFENIFDKIKDSGNILSEFKDVLNNFSNGVKASSLLIIASSVFMLAISIGLLSNISLGKVIMSLGAIAGALGILFGALKIINSSFVGKFNTTIFSLLLLAFAVGSLATSMIRLSKLSFVEIIKGTVALGALIGVLWLYTTLIDYWSPKNFIAISASLILFATAVGILSISLFALGSMKISTLAKGLISIVGIVIVFAVAMKLLGSVKLTMIGISLALVILSSAILVLTGSLAILSMIDAPKILKALGMIAIGLGIFSLYLMILSGINPLSMIGISIAMLALSVAVGVLSTSLISLSLIPSDKLLNTSLILIGIFAAIGIGMVLLSPFSLGILAVAGSMLALGVSVGIFAASLLGIALGITLVTVSLSIAATVFLSFVSMVIEGLTLVVKVVVVVISNILSALGGLTGGLFDAGSNMISGLINGLLGGVGDLVATVVEVGETIIGTICKVLNINSPSGVGIDIGQYFGQGLSGGMFNELPNIESMSGMMGNSAITPLSEYESMFWDQGSNYGSNLSNGMNDSLSMVNQSGMDMGTTAANAVNSQQENFYYSGINAATQYSNGLKSGLSGMKSISWITSETNTRDAGIRSSYASRYGTSIAQQNQQSMDARKQALEENNEWEKIISEQNDLFSNSSYSDIPLSNFNNSSGSSGASAPSSVESLGSYTVHHTFDTLYVEGVDDQDEFVSSANYAVEDIVTDILRREARV